MKVKTRTLTGRTLNYATALAEGWNRYYYPGKQCWFERGKDARGSKILRSLHELAYSTGPAGDDIIDREMISTQVFDASGPDERRWNAYMPNDMPMKKDDEINGPDRRTAAMRCWVIYKLGGEVEIPDELMET